jgi:hypothetical protein
MIYASTSSLETVHQEPHQELHDIPSLSLITCIKDLLFMTASSNESSSNESAFTFLCGQTSLSSLCFIRVEKKGSIDSCVEA